MSDGILLRELLLIRHGESLANISEGEALDSALSPRGFIQARSLGEYLAGEKIDAVFSSGLRRAVQTGAEIVTAGKMQTLGILPCACEIGMDPSYEGQNLDSLKRLCPGIDITLAGGVDSATPFSVPDPTPGEYEERYFRRAGELLDYFASRFTNGEKIALVSHAGFLTYVIFYLLGFRYVQPNRDFRLTNTGITRILFFEPGTNTYGDVIFDCINERKHLDCGYTT